MIGAILGFIALTIILPLSYFGLRELQQVIDWTYEALPELPRPSLLNKFWISIYSPLVGIVTLYYIRSDQNMQAFRTGICIGFIRSLLNRNVISDVEAEQIKTYMMDKLWSKPQSS